jgi:flavin reductase (DIM6/NTAB) family NADH-FMN oxidoreductase RutF
VTQQIKKSELIASSDLFKQAMRHLMGGVSIITVGEGEDRTGLTVTSFSALSSEPPRVLVCVNRTSSSFPIFLRYKSFGANVLAASQQHIAERFAGKGGFSGKDRYALGQWHTLASGVSILAESLAAFDCEVEEVIERHSHAIIIGRVRDVVTHAGTEGLGYWRGGYHKLGSATAT